MLKDKDTIRMIHGSGGTATAELIHELFGKAFGSGEELLEDAAVLPAGAQIVMTTDSFVVNPLFFPGGDIGRLSVCGSVNDLLCRGAVPKYLSCAAILEEGLTIGELRRIVFSLGETAKEAGVKIVCGDTKVIEGHGGLYLTTAGIGFLPEGCDISAKGAREGDAILLSGCLGDHHAAILGARLGIETNVESDCAPLCALAEAIRPYQIHTLRDVTRGGLATVLSELAEASGKSFFIEEALLPIREQVRDFCGIMGLDPLTMGNEGKLLCIVGKEDAEGTLQAMRKSPYGWDACLIGQVRQPSETETKQAGVYLKTTTGGLRRLRPLEEEGLPRIC